jgi:hypothetical protein
MLPGAPKTTPTGPNIHSPYGPYQKPPEQIPHPQLQNGPQPRYNNEIMPRQHPLTTAEAARLLQLTPRLVRRYADQDRLKHLPRRHPDGSYLFWIRDVQAFAAEPRTRGRPWPRGAQTR